MCKYILIENIAFDSTTHSFDYCIRFIYTQFMMEALTGGEKIIDFFF